MLRHELSERALLFRDAPHGVHDAVRSTTRAERHAGGPIIGERVMLDEADLPIEERAELLVALDEALERLAALDGRLAQVVECRYFGGLTEEETAAALGITARTVRRDWVKARGWLHEELYGRDVP